jgi:protein-L-isoaspartate(D-aspartate) O-methyltransferase
MNKDIDRMIADIRREVIDTRQLTGRTQFDPNVMKVMARVPRDQFVPLSLKSFAYDNGALSVGHGQTISQPYIVALMTDMLKLEPDHCVLEIGTGTGYQTAILAELVDQVYSMELIRELSETATKRLQKMGYTHIDTCVGNGYRGWQEHAPYDAIIVTAAAAFIPPDLIEQLKAGGKMVLPVGEPQMHQELMLLEKDQQGNQQLRKILDVAFVPLKQSSESENI